MTSTDRSNHQDPSPAEAVEKRIEEQERALHKYLSIGMVVGGAVNISLLASTPSLALIGFVFLSLAALTAVPALAHVQKPVFPPILLGMWMGYILAFAFALLYVILVEMRLLELALSA